MLRKVEASPLARRVILFNLAGLAVLLAGVLYLSPLRSELEARDIADLQARANLAASALSASATPALPPDLDQLVAQMQRLTLAPETAAWLFDDKFALRTTEPAMPAGDPDDRMAVLAQTAARTGAPQVSGAGWADIAVSARIPPGGATLVLTDAAHGPAAALGAHQRLVLGAFLAAALVSVALSLLLAATIAAPLSDLATAAENGREADAGRMSTNRVRIPDLTGRPDEIGRLSGAMRGMVTALYERIDANEQFAADVAHEIKNPLASLRSAIGTMRVASRPDQQAKLLEVIEHDVQRLNRLVTDISNASRLDSELVREEDERFDLVNVVRTLTDHHAEQAARSGIAFFTDLPSERIHILGLEARLAQVFVNLITNAVSFCEDGDAVRVWVRRRGNRVLVVFEDTGPGIPETALSRIFERFYSQRPEGQFGNHSGLGLAISKQIVEAHGGVIWAENIRPTDADITSDPLGARFVVGLPL
jgi:two-component system sensor histidine kinase ChvG